MEKINLLIKDYEDKKGKTSGKRYTRFETNQGWFSAFDADVIDPIKKLEGKWALCGVVITDANKNIREFHGEGKEESSSENMTGDDAEKVVESRPAPARAESSEGKGTSYYTSYAKDIFCAMLAVNPKVTEEESVLNMMRKAVALVKEAKKNFE